MRGANGMLPSSAEAAQQAVRGAASEDDGQLVLEGVSHDDVDDQPAAAARR